MAIKYFVDEEDVGNFGSPLFGVKADTKLFDSYAEADALADEWPKGEDVPCQVWKFDTDTGNIDLVAWNQQ